MIKLVMDLDPGSVILLMCIPVIVTIGILSFVNHMITRKKENNKDAVSEKDKESD